MHAADVVVVLMLSAPPQRVEVAQVEPAAQITFIPYPSLARQVRAFFRLYDDSESERCRMHVNAR